MCCSSCRGTYFSGPCSVCRKSSCGGVHRSCASGELRHGAYSVRRTSSCYEIDEICRDDFEELSYVTRMSRKRLWRRVWHGCSSPLGASNSERSWRRLSKRLCYEEGFDEMKRTRAYCGMFEEEDDTLARCQGPDCSLRSADYEIPWTLRGCLRPLRRCTVAELSMVPACKACCDDWCGCP